MIFMPFDSFKALIFSVICTFVIPQLVSGGATESPALAELRQVLGAYDPCTLEAGAKAPLDGQKHKCAELFQKFIALPADQRYNCPDAMDSDCRKVGDKWNCTVLARPMGKMVDASVYETQPLAACLGGLEEWVSQQEARGNTIPWVKILKGRLSPPPEGTKFTIPPHL
nr:PREDICTED: uncharacterized protein LOC109036915 [Bemisia tabaci]